MTNEQIWAQSTVMERCEMLKARLDRMEMWTRDRDAKAELVEEYGMRPGGIITNAEIARLRRVEEAARNWHEDSARRAAVDPTEYNRWRALGVALDSEPGR